MDKKEELKRLKAALQVMEMQIKDKVYNAQLENQKRKYEKLQQKIEELEKVE